MLLRVLYEQQKYLIMRKRNNLQAKFLTTNNGPSIFYGFIMELTAAFMILEFHITIYLEYPCEKG